MRITNIRFTQKANPGNYESLEFGAEAVLGEDEDIQEATAKLADYVDWHARKQIRDGYARSYRKTVADENAPADKKAEAEAWLAKYDARRAIVEAM